MNVDWLEFRLNFQYLFFELLQSCLVLENLAKESVADVFGVKNSREKFMGVLFPTNVFIMRCLVSLWFVIDQLLDKTVIHEQNIKVAVMSNNWNIGFANQLQNLSKTENLLKLLLFSKLDVFEVGDFFILISKFCQSYRVFIRLLLRQFLVFLIDQFVVVSTDKRVVLCYLHGLFIAFYEFLDISRYLQNLLFLIISHIWQHLVKGFIIVLVVHLIKNIRTELFLQRTWHIWYSLFEPSCPVHVVIVEEVNCTNLESDIGVIKTL